MRPFTFDHALGGGGDAREDLEQGALAGPVAPDDAQRLALLHLQVDIAQRPDDLAVAVRLVLLPDPEVSGSGLWRTSCPPYG